MPVFIYIFIVMVYHVHELYYTMVRVWLRVMVFNATFNNISAISWQSILLVEETRVSGENHRSVASLWQTLSHNVVLSHFTWVGFKLTALVVIGTDCIGSYKFNYHMITTTMAPCGEMGNTEMINIIVVKRYPSKTNIENNVIFWENHGVNKCLVSFNFSQ